MRITLWNVAALLIVFVALFWVVVGIGYTFDYFMRRKWRR